MILVTGGTGFVGPKVVHALRAAGARRPRARPQARAAPETLKAWGCELVAGRRHRRRRACGGAVDGCDAVVHLVAIITGKPADFERVMVAGHAEPRRRGEGGGRPPVRADERARRRASRRRTLVPYYRAKWEMEQAVRGVRARARDLPAELRLRPRRRRAADLRPPGALVAGHAGRRRAASGGSSRSGSTTSPRSSPRRSTCRRRRTGRSSSAGPTRVTWNELYAADRARRSGSGARQLHLPVALVRAGAAVAERLPERPDHPRPADDARGGRQRRATSAPAREAFGIEPIALDEQLRRAA